MPAANAAANPDITLTPQLVDDLPPRVAAPLPPPPLEELRHGLEQNRNSTRRVFRRLLLAEDYDTVARAVALLGDFVVQDLSHDPDLKRPLIAAGARTAATLRTPLTDDARDELLRTIHAEFVADRVAYRSLDVIPEFEGILGWRPEAFASALNNFDDRAQLLLLRHAPAHLTQHYLKGLTPQARTARVQAVLEAPPASPEEVAGLADELDAQSQAALLGGYEADHVADVLDALPTADQEMAMTSLALTRPDFVRRSGLLLESTLLSVPANALASAWGEVPVDTWIAYLRTAPEPIRTRALEACPARLRSTVEDELSLRVAPNPAAATAARRDIVQAALDAAPS